MIEDERRVRRDARRRIRDADTAHAGGRAWLHANTAEEATWTGDTLVIELRYFAGLADAIIAVGFLFERNALPN